MILVCFNLFNAFVMFHIGVLSVSLDKSLHRANLIALTNAYLVLTTYSPLLQVRTNCCLVEASLRKYAESMFLPRLNLALGPHLIIMI